MCCEYSGLPAASANASATHPVEAAQAEPGNENDAVLPVPSLARVEALEAAAAAAQAAEPPAEEAAVLHPTEGASGVHGQEKKPEAVLPWGSLPGQFSV